MRPYDQAAAQHAAGIKDDQLLTPREVARLFGVNTATIARWSREGRLDSSVTPGGHRRYRLPDVRAMMEE